MTCWWSICPSYDAVQFLHMMHKTFPNQTSTDATLINSLSSLHAMVIDPFLSFNSYSSIPATITSYLHLSWRLWNALNLIFQPAMLFNSVTFSFSANKEQMTSFVLEQTRNWGCCFLLNLYFLRLQRVRHVTIKFVILKISVNQKQVSI